MKFTAIKEDIISDLLFVNSVVTKRNVQPILSTIKFNLSPDMSSIEASDGYVTLNCKSEFKATEKVDVCIEAQPFVDIVSRLYGELTFTVKDNRVVIQSKTGKYECPAYTDVSLFPEANLNDLEDCLIIEYDELKQGISDVSVSIEKNELRPVMESVYLDAEKKCIVGANMGGVSVKYTDISGEKSVVIPSYALPYLKFSGKVDISSNRTMLVFRDEKSVVICKQSEYKYPDYRSIIDNVGGQTGIVDAEELLRVISTVSVCSDINIHSVMLSFKKDHIDISSNDSMTGLSGSESLPYTGDLNFDVKFNGVKLSRLLSKYKGTLVFAIESPQKPLQLGKGSRLTSIIAPIL